MKRNILILTTAFALVLILTIGSTFAVKQVSKEWVESRQKQGFFNAIGLWWAETMRSLSGLTVVGGKLCSTYPDESGQCHDSSFCVVRCPSYLSGGCAIPIFDRDYQFIYEAQISPGQTVDVMSGQYWENYYCNLDCSCTLYQDAGCGAGPCGSNKMLRQRTCDVDPSTGKPCAEEQACIYSDKCVSIPSCGNGICEAGETQSNCPSDCGAPSQEPKIQEYSLPEVTVVGRKIVGKVFFKNVGGQMTESYLVEMQPRPHGELPLSWISEPKVCDASHPENVHKDFVIDPGDQRIITLETPNLEDGAYDVYFLTRDKCWYLGNKRVEPYYYSFMAGTFTIGAPPSCGNGICEAGETQSNCPSDCGTWLTLLIEYWYVIVGIIIVVTGIVIYTRR